MNVETAPPPAPTPGGHRTGAPSAEARFDSHEVGTDPLDTTELDDAAAVPAQDLALWATLCAAPPAADRPEDAEAFAAAGRMPAAELPLTAIEQLNVELAALVGAGAHGDLDTCSFDLELPGFGRLQGRLSIRRDRADLELRALSPGIAAALRSRRQALQQGIDQAVGGDHDVNLSIA